MTNRFIAIFLILFLTSCSISQKSRSLAGDNEFSHELILEREYLFRLKLMETISLIQKRKEFQQENLPDFDGTFKDNQLDDLIGQKLRSLGDELLDIYEDQYDWPRGMKGFIKKSIQWDNLKIIVKKLIKSQRGLIKENGFGGFLMIVLNSVLKKALPVFFISQGFPSYIVLGSAYFPYKGILKLGWGKLRNSIQQVVNKGHYVDEEIYHKNQKLNKEVIEELNITSEKDELIFLRSDENWIETARVENPTIIRKVYRKFLKLFGIKEKLDLAVLIKYCEENNLHTNFVSDLDKNKFVNNSIKSMHIINKIFTESSIEEIAKFKLDFSESFDKVLKPSAYNELTSWSVKMFKSKKSSDIRKLLKEVPEDVDAYTVLKIFEDSLMPFWKDHLDVGYFKYRSLDIELERLKAKIITKKDVIELRWSEEWLKEFNSMLSLSMKTKSQGCLFYLNRILFL